MPGFYDKLQAPEDWERQQLANMPETEASLKALVGVESLSEHSDMRPLEAIRFGSTLEFNGIGGGYQGEGEKTIIPSKAFVKITCRLVPDQDPFEIQKCVAAAIRERCPKGVTLELKLGHGGYAYGVNPVHYREVHHTKPNTASKAFTIAHEQATKIWGREPIYVREGGSIPVIADLCKLLESDCLMIGLFTPMDNLHSPNESFHLDIVRKATELYERLFTGLGTETK